MTKYVIDLPEGVKFIVGKGYMMLSEKELLRIPVENLQEYNAPTVVGNATVEKRVIELPDYVIVELETIKEDNGNDNLQGFMNDVNDDDEIWQSVEQFNSSGMPTDALLGEWWLGHIEFVKKPDQKFIVAVDSPTEFGRVEKEENGNVTVSYYHFNVKTQMFTEPEADELVAGLTALNARKVEVED